MIPLLLGAPQVGAQPMTVAAPPSIERARAPEEKVAANHVFFEALGSGLLYSVSYERLFDAWHLGLRGGASYFTYPVSSYGRSGNLTLVSFPVLASYYVTWGRHHLQLGLGATVLYTGASSDSEGVRFTAERSGLGLAATAMVGYRYWPRDGGFSVGVGFTPLLRTSKLLPWGGASVGYVF